METSSNNNPTLKIIFVVLLLALLGELGYVFMTVNKKGANVTSTPAVAVTQAVSITPPTILLTTPVREKFKGKIIKIDVPNTTPSTKIKFLFMMSDGIEKPQVFFFNENELKYLKVTDSTGKNFSYKDLKVDQNIEFIQEYGLKEKPYFNLEIKIID